MKRERPGHRRAACGLGALLATAAAALVVGGPAAAATASVPARTAATAVRLGGSVGALPLGSAVLGPVESQEPGSADVVLRPRDPAALQSFATAVSTPGSPSYRDYLNTAAFRQAFGPRPQTVADLRAWLADSGLAVGATSANGMTVPVSGTVGQLEQVFAVSLVRARLPGGRVARAVTADPEVPASLAPSVEGVVGLSTVVEAHPQVAPDPLYPHPTTAAGAVEQSRGSQAPSAQTTLGPHVGPSACPTAAAAARAYHGWTADSLASAYGLSTLYAAGRVGAAQQVGIFELAPYSPSDIGTYQACFGTSAAIVDVNVDGGPPPGPIDEADLDIETVAGLAPSAVITVFSGPNSEQGALDTYTQMVDDPSVRVLSTSWGTCEPDLDPAGRAAEEALFEQAASQGQTVLAASGDSGSSDCYDPSGDPPDRDMSLAVDDPSDQPDVTGVGGTSLSSFTPDDPVESTWNSDGGAGGGGNSAVFVAPSWQQIPAAQNPYTSDTCGDAQDLQCREVPDVAASADPEHGDIVYVGGTWIPLGGTSAAAPLWAALTADTNQGCAAAAGFLNTKLYPAGAGGSPPFHDVTTGDNNLFGGPQYPATAGYDLATGWGSPNAPDLLGVFTGAAAGCPSVTNVDPGAGPAVGGTTVVISGSGFGSGAPAVFFGGVAAPVLSHSPTSVTVTTPDVTTGRTVSVTVTTTGTAGGTSAAVLESRFTFVSPHVTSVVPVKGPTSGGGRVTIQGSDFGGVTSVRFGSVESPVFRVTSGSALVAEVPAGPATGATVDVVVTNPDGQSPLVPADRYVYALPGYWLVASDGGIFSYGHAPFYGSTGGMHLNQPVVGVAATADNGGYWLVASDGGVFAYGDAGFYGSTGGMHLNRPVVGMAATPDGGGYWLVASDGGVFAYGDAGFYGSTGGMHLNQPVVGMAATPDGGGYWLVASDGGIFAYGDAGFYGSTGGMHLNRPVVGMAATPDGGGYWLVASDGGIFAYGDAGFYGSTGGMHLNRPVVGMASSLTGSGYWLVASDGGIFAYGDAAFFGSTGGMHLNQPVVGMAAT